MSRKANFNDQPKPKKVGTSLRTHAGAARDHFTGQLYKGPGEDTALSNRPGRGASGESSN